MMRFNSIKQKVVILDLIMVLPLFVLLCVVLLLVFRESNLTMNYSELDVLDEKCNNISDSNLEIVKISNAMYLDSTINHILSQKTQATGYTYLENEQLIQTKMVELSGMYPQSQYQMMMLCNNGASYFQDSLRFRDDALDLADIEKEPWYDEAMEEGADIYFLPKYRSPILQSLFQEDMLFAVRTIRNLNSGRSVGLLIIAVSQNIWGSEILKNNESTEHSMAIDQYGKIIFASDPNLYDMDIASSSYYDKISNYSKGFFLGNVNQEYSHIRFASIKDTGWKLITYTPYQNTWSQYTIMMGILGVGVLIVLIAIVFYNCNFISRRVERINDNILKVSQGNLKTRIQENYEIEFQELCSNFNIMLDCIENLMIQLEMEEQEKHHLEIQALQAQINPHFFYNTLTTIRFMIQMEQYPEADRALLAFSKLLRKSFADSRKVISIREELAMTKEYLELMQLRYKDGFQWDITIEPEVATYGILKNTIQPLVENSISHGFNMKQGMGHIFIRAYRKDKFVIVEVEDDGVGVDLEKVHVSINGNQTLKSRDQFSGIGLSNIQMRIVRNFGKKFGLKAMLNASGGVTFIMSIPVLDVEGGIQ